MTTKHEFQTGVGDITALVMSNSEFYELCNEIESKMEKIITKDQVQCLRDNGYIPMVKRGSLTQFIFDKYEVETNMLSVIIRGNGPAVFARTFSQGQA